VVLMTPFELLAVAEGRPHQVATLDGRAVRVRIPTVDELLAAAERAGDELESQGLHRGPGMNREQAENLVRPVPDMTVLAKEMVAKVRLAEARAEQLLHELREAKARADRYQAGMSRSDSALARARVKADELADELRGEG
jgi:hypothetical protein